MDSTAIVRRTPKGEAELAQRAGGLERNLRYVLILVDGHSSVQKISEKGAGLPDIEAALEELLARGFVGIGEGGSHPALVKSQLIAIAQEVLGGDAQKVVKKLQAAPDTVDGLREVVQGCKKLVRLMIDEQKAERLAVRCAEVLERL